MLGPLLSRREVVLFFQVLLRQIVEQPHSLVGACGIAEGAKDQAHVGPKAAKSIHNLTGPSSSPPLVERDQELRTAWRPGSWGITILK